MSNQIKKRKLNPVFLATVAGVLLVILVGLVLLLTLLPGEKNEFEPGATNASGEAMVQIETPYAVLEFPAKWSDQLDYQGSEDNGVYTGNFYCCIGDQKLEIFRVYFNNAEAGSLIGFVDHDGKPVAFSVESFETEETDNWTEDERYIITGMTEGINDVITAVMGNGTDG